MPDKIAFATVHKDTEPKPNGWTFWSRQSYPTYGPWGLGAFNGWHGPTNTDGEGNVVWTAPPLNPPYMTQGTQQDWINHIISQNSLFSGFTKYSSRGEVWNGNAAQTQMTQTRFAVLWDGSDEYILSHPLLKHASQYPDSIPVGPGTNYVGPFSVEEAAEIVWKVKKWKANFNPTCRIVTNLGSSDWTEAESDQPTVDVTLYTLVDENGQTLYQNSSEKQFFLEKKGFVHTQMGHGTPYLDNPTFTFSVYHDVVSLIDDPSKYYIKMDLQVSVISRALDPNGQANKGLSLGLEKPLGFIIQRDNICPDVESFSANFALWSDGLDIGKSYLPFNEGGCFTAIEGVTTTNQMQFTLPNGRSIQIPLYGSLVTDRYLTWVPTWDHGEHDQNLVTPTLGSLSIEPLEYWPYDDGNGNPIWDTQTGAMLRDPVTGLPVS